MRICPNCLKPIVWNEKTALDNRGDITLVYCDAACQSEFQAKRKSYKPPINLIMFLIVLGLAVVIGAVYALAAPPPNASGQYRQWYLDQKQLDEPPMCDGDGKCSLKSCCGGPEEEGGDGRKVNVRWVGHDEALGDRYEVQIGDKWILYPRAVPKEPTQRNPTGANVLWLKVFQDGSITFYCLRLSVGT